MFNLTDCFIDCSIDFSTISIYNSSTTTTALHLPGVCCRVVPRARFLPGVPEAPGSPQLLVEALHPIKAGTGSQGAEQGGVGRDGGPEVTRGGRSGGSELLEIKRTGGPGDPGSGEGGEFSDIPVLQSDIWS